MNIDKKINFFFRLVRRTRTILKEKGLISAIRQGVDHLRSSVFQCHASVMGRNIFRDDPIPVTEIDLKTNEITISDKDDINELTKIDEWRITKSATLKMLEEGRLCYVAKHQDHIVGCVWIDIRGEFWDFYLRRTLRLAPNEVFYWRTLTVPAFRGKGILPFLQAKIDVDFAQRFDKTFALGWVENNNKSMLRSLGKLGYIRVGRLGFFQVLGIRFHYLWGRRAFKETQKRFSVQNMDKSPFILYSKLGRLSKNLNRPIL